MEILFTPFLPLLLLFFIDMDIFFLTSRRAERYFHQSGISFPPSSSGGGEGGGGQRTKANRIFLFFSLSLCFFLSFYLSFLLSSSFDPCYYYYYDYFIIFFCRRNCGETKGFIIIFFFLETVDFLLFSIYFFMDVIN